MGMDDAQQFKLEMQVLVEKVRQTRDHLLEATKEGQERGGADARDV
jgi:hypothetical protein